MSLENKPQDHHYWETRPKDDPKRDWLEQTDNWVNDYAKSVNHSHREMVLEALETIPDFKSVLEVGCNAGPNLDKIHQSYPSVKCTGIDVNNDAIETAEKNIPFADVKVGNVLSLPFEDHTFDVVLADAVLMYVDANNIEMALSEMMRVCKKRLILIEWKSDKIEGEIKNFHWARDYVSLLRQVGWKGTIQSQELTEENWSTKTWSNNGICIVAYHHQ